MTDEQKFKEIPELLDQLDALSEFYPLPTAVWKDIRKLMFLSYDEGYTKGFKVGYDEGWESSNVSTEMNTWSSDDD